MYTWNWHNIINQIYFSKQKNRHSGAELSGDVVPLAHCTGPYNPPQGDPQGEEEILFQEIFQTE